MRYTTLQNPPNITKFGLISVELTDFALDLGLQYNDNRNCAIVSLARFLLYTLL